MAKEIPLSQKFKGKRKVVFIVLTALLTAITTAGGIFLLFYLLIEVFKIPGTIAQQPSRAVYFLYLMPVPFLAGGLWGAGMAALVGKPFWPAARAMSWYWGGTFIIAVLALDLTQLFNGFFITTVNFIPNSLHYWYTLVFVIGVAIFVRNNVRKLLIHLDLENIQKSASIRSGVAAAGAFLLTSLFLLFALGWQVGGPLSGQAYSMISISHVCNFAAALAAGWVLGWQIAGSAIPPETNDLRSR